MTFGMLYWLVPRLFQTKLYSKKLARPALLGRDARHPALRRRDVRRRRHAGPDVARVRRDRHAAYPDFVETVVRVVPMYWMRALGGSLYIVGMLLIGLQPLQDGATRPATYEGRCRGAASAWYAREEYVTAPARWPTQPPASMDWHRAWERPHVLHRDHGVAVVVASLFEILPTFLIALERADDRVGEAVHAARARRPRPLHPRGLLTTATRRWCGRSATRRSATASTRSPASSSTTIRSCGARAHRPGSPPSAAAIRPLARAPHGGSARRDAAVDHAGVPAFAREAARLCRNRGQCRRAVDVLGVPYGDSDQPGTADGALDGGLTGPIPSRARAVRTGFRTNQIVALVAYLAATRPRHQGGRGVGARHDEPHRRRAARVSPATPRSPYELFLIAFIGVDICCSCHARSIAACAVS